MNYIDAIDLGISAHRPHNEIARKIFLSYPTYVFIGNEELQFEILDDVATFFGIPITAVQVVGSAKIGLSLHKGTEFAASRSDLDLSIIDTYLYSRYLSIGLSTSKGYSDGASFPIKNGQSTKSQYLLYLSRGIFRPDLMPSGPHRAEWNNYFGRLSSKHANHFTSISASVYISQACFESKQRSVIKARAVLGNI
jgi:hypothetical protein